MRPRAGRGPRAAALLLASLLTTALATSTLVSAEASGPGDGTVAVPLGDHPARTRAPLVPASGVWLGVSIDWANDSLADYAARLRMRPAVAVSFVRMPLTAADRRNLDAAVEQARQVGSMLLVTLEPYGGLAAVTPEAARQLAERLARYQRRGVATFVRFAHEMNGSWYPWSQDPAAYVRTFRLVASAVHRISPRSAMMWAPNYGGGYPFTGGRYQAPADSTRATLLDTDGDGSVTGADDPYRPYWPGLAAVDWVGMSLYHWGSAYPWGENEVPEPGKFGDLLRGTYDGLAGDQTLVPDFYAEYGAAMARPVAITETAALYVPGAVGGATELAVKRAWWRQVLAPSVHRDLPLVKMVNWFEWVKPEPEVGTEVDWSVTGRRVVRTAFRRDLPSWLRGVAAPSRPAPRPPHTRTPTAR